jgi:hypothetical protein
LTEPNPSLQLGRVYYGWILVGLGLVSMSFWFGICGHHRLLCFLRLHPDRRFEESKEESDK